MWQLNIPSPNIGSPFDNEVEHNYRITALLAVELTGSLSLQNDEAILEIAIARCQILRPYNAHQHKTWIHLLLRFNALCYCCYLSEL